MNKQAGREEGKKEMRDNVDLIFRCIVRGEKRDRHSG